ncbi:hypothetical protein ACFLZX_03015 [Nanoarchaeota archaeon]
MEVKTKEHFKKLAEIVIESKSLLTALDYDFQVTRSRHKYLDTACAMEGIYRLKDSSFIMETLDGASTYVTHNYIAEFNPYGRMVELKLR